MTEKSKVNVKMTVEIHDRGNKMKTVIEEQGQLIENETTTILKFSEKDENNETIDSFITITKDSVSVKRSGAISMLQKFKQKQITENMYRHPFGTMHMETKTDQIMYEKPTERKQGKLFMSYTTSLDGENPRRQRLTIVMTKASTPV